MITSWNRGAEKMFGYTAQEAIGRPITTIIPPERLEEEEDVLATLRRGETVDHFDTIRVTKDRRTIPVSIAVSPITNERGIIVGASAVARDITERVRRERTTRFLDETGSVLDASLEYEKTLKTLARLIFRKRNGGAMPPFRFSEARLHFSVLDDLDDPRASLKWCRENFFPYSISG